MFTRIYALAVCFSAMICLTVTSGIVVYDVVQISFPEFTMNAHHYESLQSNQRFRQGTYPGMGAVMINRAGYPQAMPGSEKPPEPLTDAQITELRIQALAQAVDNSRHNSINSLIRMAIVLMVSGLVFFIHWRLAQKLEQAGH
ncbi:MAG: hypothetical protein KUG79_02610 [Pseudomonadales bacterium]|nr:hypothetical protein [Pseudomonadales bacterium]